MHFKSLFTLVAITLFNSLNVLAQSKPFGPVDLNSMPRPGSYVATKEGDKVVYSLSTYDPKTDARTIKYHVLDVATGKSTDITPLTSTDFSPLSFIQKDRIAFLSSRSGKPNIWSLDLNAGSSSLIQHTNFNYTQLNGPKIDTANRKLIFTTGVSVKDIKKSFSTVRSYERSYFRFWDQWYDYVHQHIHVADFSLDKATNEAKNLFVNTPNFESPLRPFNELSAYHLSSDGKYVAFVTRPDTPYQAVKSTTELYLVPTSGNPTPELISKGIGANFAPKFSPNGRYLVWVYVDSDTNLYGDNLITVYDLKTKTRKVINQSWEISITEFFFSDDSKSIFLNVADDGYYKLFEFNIETSKPTAITKTGNCNLIAQVNNTLLITKHTRTKSAEIYSVKRDGTDLKLLTDFNVKYLEQFGLNEYESFYFDGALNDKVQGFLIKPSNFNPAKKYPVVVFVHGGPEPSFFDDWSYSWNPQILASSGYAIIGINFHGSIGFGNKFTKSVNGNWGDLPLEDHIKGLDYALDKYKFLDSGKMAAWGGSYGGYLVNYFNGKTNRFKALISHSGPFDLTSIYHSTDFLHFTTVEYGGDMWDPRAFASAKRQSPSNYIQNWKTPMLLSVGDRDYRVPNTETYSTFSALLRRKVPARLLNFPDENHWLMKPANNLRWQLEAVDWTAKWLNMTNPFEHDF
ncbi:alpha/beta-hydrolase [Neoconidiobolus thromboides FSU 785]|nr:alpha/beta-hydrolase [Neoconidiobolus thromboides FSU 785]